MPIDANRFAINPVIVGQHLDRALGLLRGYEADGLLFFRDSNLLGFCGVPLAPSDRLVCGLLNLRGQMVFIVPAFEASAADGLPPDSELLAWEENEDPFAAVAEAARRLGIAKGLIFLDGNTWLEVHSRLHAALPNARLDLDPGVIESVRLRKTAEEIAAIRAACVHTGMIYPHIADCLRAGLSELELSRQVTSRLRSDGVDPCGDLIQGGTSAAVPHQPTSLRILQDGDAVIVDFVSRRDGYHGDMTRTFAVGRVRPEVKRAYAAVRAAQQAGIRAVRPGVTCESVDRAARAVLEAEGLGEYFAHRLGHGIGLDGHEPPYIVQGNRQVLEPGMCFTIEPGVYLEGKFGIRIEDVVVVTKDGCEILSGDVPTDVSEEFRSSAPATTPRTTVGPCAVS